MSRRSKGRSRTRSRYGIQVQTTQTPSRRSVSASSRKRRSPTGSSLPRYRSSPVQSVAGTRRVRSEPRDRGVTVLPPRKRAARKRMSPALVSTRTLNENARPKTPAKCARKKAARRAVIIATGRGGINGAKRYRQHERCR